jgi:hypothetical protein
MQNAWVGRHKSKKLKVPEKTQLLLKMEDLPQKWKGNV